ncbi:MAG: hypothetical protein ACE5J3_08005 [Methanosarcinales archaeon]
MTLKEEHIELSEEFFALAEELLESDTYAKIATSAELLLVSLDHLIDAHLSYLGPWRAGRKERHEQFRVDVLEDDTYLEQAEVRLNLLNVITRTRHLRDALLYARGGKVYNTETAKKKVKELIKDVKIYRSIIKNEVL